MVAGLPRFEDPDLILGAEGFSDAGVYRLRDDLLLVQSVDFFPPVVDDPFLFGKIAACNALSDLYAMGARPLTAMNIVGFPDDKLDLGVLEQILRGGSETVREAGAVVLGGHSVRDAEIKFGMAVTGTATFETLLQNSSGRAGDRLVLTKSLGTGFVTTAARAQCCPPALLEAATRRMAMLNRAARDSAHFVGARAATDITGFGLAGHAAEIAMASGVTLALDLARLPLLPGVEALVRAGHRTRASASNRRFVDSVALIDPAVDPLLLDVALESETSGGLLLCVAAERADELVEHARTLGATDSCQVGEVLARTERPLWLRP